MKTLKTLGLDNEILYTCGAYSPRFIANTSRPSVHSYALAIDFNCHLRHVNSFSDEFVKVWEDHGFIWGGRWRKPDYMHFQFTQENY